MARRILTCSQDVQLLACCLLFFPYCMFCTMYPEDFDIVTMAIKPTCVNRQMIASINAFVLPKPRIIHVVTARGCDVFTRFANNVVCHEESDLVPYMTAPAVAEWLRARFPSNSAADTARIKRRAAWFFQQFIKLGVATFVPGLSDYFLIFDSDLIALRPLTWFLPREPPSDDPGTAASRLPFPAVIPVHGKSEEGCVNPHPFRMLVHTGGWLPKRGYMKTYEALSGRAILFGHDNMSFITHNVLVYKPYMAEFLASITRERYSDLPHGWALSILDAVAKLEGVEELIVGFSEFWSYLSWVQDRHPCAFMQTRERAWSRTPVLPVRRLNVAFAAGNETFIRVCCPTTANILATQERGFYFVGYELGQLPWCSYRHDAFRNGYAEWYVAS